MEVWADYAQFALVELGDIPEPVVHTNGLVAPLEEGIVKVHTGIEFGPVDVRVEALEAAPDVVDDTDVWEEIAEVSAAVGSRPVYLVGTDLVGPAVDAATLDPGRLRVRVHCRGRDESYDLAVDEASEHYLVQLWPEGDEGPEAVIRRSDRAGDNIRLSVAAAQPVR